MKSPDLKTSEEPIKEGGFFRVYPNRIELFWDDVATFIIHEGGEMETIPKPGVDPKRIEVYKSGSPYTTQLFMKGHLVMHGSCLNVNQQVFGFLGRSGMGKSTTARALMRAGHEMISDDFLAFDDIFKSTELLPGLPQMRLWGDALEHFGGEEPKSQIHPDHEKFSLDIPVKQEEKHSVDAIFLLEYADESEIEEIKGSAAFEALFAQVKPIFYIHGKSEQKTFLQVGALASRVRVFRLKRKKDLNELENLVPLIEQALA